MSYRVTAPLVVAADQGGHNRHYYHGSTIHYLNEVQKAHFLRKGLVAEIVEAEPVKHEDPRPAPKGKPAKTALESAWVDYAVSQGFSREEAESKGKQELIEALG